MPHGISIDFSRTTTTDCLPTKENSNKIHDRHGGIWQNRILQSSRQARRRQCTKGMWLGRASDINEHLMGTSRGLVKSRTIKRVIPAENWNRDIFDTFAGRPWNPREMVPLILRFLRTTKTVHQIPQCPTTLRLHLDLDRHLQTDHEDINNPFKRIKWS